MCILASILQAALLSVAATSSTTACSTKTCTVDESTGNVTSAFAYTEPRSVSAARDASITAATDAPERLSAYRARGTGRVTGEQRTFDTDTVGTSSGTLSLLSTVSFTVVIGGQRVDFPLSTVTVSLDLPTRSGDYTLTELNASVCEAFESGVPVCNAAAGTFAFRATDSSSVDGDLVFAVPPGKSDGPLLSGTAHVHHESRASSSPCPDIGGPSGVFAPE